MKLIHYLVTFITCAHIEEHAQGLETRQKTATQRLYGAILSFKILMEIFLRYCFRFFN